MSVLGAQWKLSYHNWYRCQSTGQCKVKPFNTNTAFAKREEFQWCLYLPRQDSGPLLLEQLSRGHHLWHGSPNGTPSEDGLVLRYGTAYKAYLVLTCHHWAITVGMPWTWHGNGHNRAVVLMCLSNAEAPLLFLVLCSGLQTSGLGMVVRQKGHGGGSWLEMLQSHGMVWVGWGCRSSRKVVTLDPSWCSQ